MTLTERLLSKVEKQPDNCWFFTGAKDQKGYGIIQVDNIATKAHRLSYMLHNGPIPEGKLIMHTCDNPSCINPEHLKVGTPHDNVLDMIAKGRRVDHGVRKTKGSSALTEDDVTVIRKRFELGHSNTDIAVDYRVTKTAIRHIRIGKSWGWFK